MSAPETTLFVGMTVEQLWQPVPGGSGTYVTELARALSERPDVRLTGLAARPSGAPAVPLPSSMTVRHSRLPRWALYELWNRGRWTARLPSIRVSPAQGATDVLHATTWAIPPRTAPLAVTIHDLAFLREPSHFTRRGNAFFRRALATALDEADVVVVPSLTTAEDCIAHGFAPERLRVIHHGVQVPSVTDSEVARFREVHDLVRPYVLWCGAIEPRKNLANLLEAFGRLVNQDDAGLDLVLVGPVGWGGASAEVAARAARLPPGRVHMLGRLAPLELHRAYAGALVFCFPSIWEGFGMPVLEAMAHGTPVVTSIGTSMQEVSPAGALLVDPLSPDDIVRGLREAVDRRAELSAAAVRNAARFTWERSAEMHVAAYRDAVNRRQRRVRA